MPFEYVGIADIFGDGQLRFSAAVHSAQILAHDRDLLTSLTTSLAVGSESNTVLSVAAYQRIVGVVLCQSGQVAATWRQGVTSGTWDISSGLGNVVSGTTLVLDSLQYLPLGNLFLSGNSASGVVRADLYGSIVR